MTQAIHKFSHPGWQRTHYDREFMTMFLIAAIAAAPILLIAAYLLSEFIAFDFGALTVSVGFVGVTLFSIFMWSGYLFMIVGTLFILGMLAISPIIAYRRHEKEQEKERPQADVADAGRGQRRHVPTAPKVPQQAA